MFVADALDLKAGSHAMDMGGWDVIYASNVDKLNAVLAQSSQKLLPSFSFSDSAMQIAFSGSFGPWAIQSGGTANRINLLVPITSGQLTAPQFSNPISLDDVQPVLNLALTLVEGSSAGTKDLKFDISSNSTSPSNKDGDVYLSNVDLSGKLKQRDPTGQAASILRDWFGQVFVANASKISFVFATVFTDPQDEPWLKPTATGVSYFQDTSGSIKAVGIKSITQSPWGASGLSTAIDPSLLVATDDLFYAISKGVFMKNLLLPSIASALGVGAGDLRFNGSSSPSTQDDCSISNSVPIATKSVENAGTHYYPILTSYNVTISDNQITTTASGKFDITGLHDAYVTFDNLEVVNEITYDAATKKLGFKLVSETKPSTDSHIPWYEKAITWIVPVVGLIVNVVMDIVVATIESSVEDALEGTGNLSVSSIQLDTAVWTGLEQFNVDSADLEQALVIRAAQ